MNSQERKIWYTKLGRTRYREIWELQKKLHTLVAEGVLEDIFLINEHESVYTLGKSGDKNHLLANERELKSNRVDYFEIDRGGDITYHGPGQIVGYPILNLEHFRKDIHHYLRQLEEVIIRTLKHFDVQGERAEGETGVWVHNEKIAAIGIKVSRWTTMHGFAFNINTDLKYYDRIIPCGIFYKGVTSLSEVLKTAIHIDEVLQFLLNEFREVFDIEMMEISSVQLNSLIKRNGSENIIFKERVL